MLKPSYLYGGIPLTQRIAERVYGAERTANEGPQLAMTKRLVIRYLDNMEQVVANQQAFENAMQVMSEYRDNYGVFLDSIDNKVEQQDTSLGDLDNLIMTQYQLVAAEADVPATKLLSTSPKGFQSTGEHEIDSYHETLESIQENELTDIVDRHHECLMRSHIAPLTKSKQPFDISIEWNPLAVQSKRENAETEEIKSRTRKTYQDSGAIDAYDIRDSLISDEDSDFTGLEAIDRPDYDDEDLDDDDLLQETTPPPNDNNTPKAGGRLPKKDKYKEAIDQSGTAQDYIRKWGTKWAVFSEKGKRLSDGYNDKKDAVKRLREIEYYKRKGK